MVIINLWHFFIELFTSGHYSSVSSAARWAVWSTQVPTWFVSIPTSWCFPGARALMCLYSPSVVQLIFHSSVLPILSNFSFTSFLMIGPVWLLSHWIRLTVSVLMPNYLYSGRLSMRSYGFKKTVTHSVKTKTTRMSVRCFLWQRLKSLFVG